MKQILDNEDTRTAISLFSNCGAGDLGYKQAGFQFDVMAELDPKRLEVCLLNHTEAKGIPGDLRNSWTEVVSEYRKKWGPIDPALLAACPPCQGMSTARSDRGLEEDADAGSKDDRNLLVTVIIKVVKKLKPMIVVVENVPAFLTRKVRHPETCEPISAATLLIQKLIYRYEVFPILTDLSDYGVPQTRKRAFLTFIRRDVEGLQRLIYEHRAPFPRPTYSIDYGGTGPIKLYDALKRLALPSLDAGSPITAKSDVGGGLHSVPVWGKRQYEMVSLIPPNSGASAWENNVCVECGVLDELGPEDAICPKCGQPLPRPIVKESGNSYRLVNGFRSSSYRRMSPEKPAATITTASGHIGSDRTIHPFENRLLSPFECAALQTFPSNFKWGNTLQKRGKTNIRRMIGEAVPPFFTSQHGEVLKGILTGKLTRARISLSDPRCTKARMKLGLPSM